KNRIAPGPDSIRPNHLKNLPPVLVNTLAPLFTRYLSKCKDPTHWKASKTVLLFKKAGLQDIGNYRPIRLLSVVYKHFNRVILNRIDRTLYKEQPCEQAQFQKGFSAMDDIHTVRKLIEVSRQYKRQLFLTFIDLMEVFDSIKIDAIMETIESLVVATQYI
ncbi:hypothetical protein Angca_007888, partial [Angiostrongylus cantonensis]